MRESTRRLYVSLVQQHFSKIRMNADSIEAKHFSSLPLQNYLWAELSRPCLNVEEQQRNTFCAVRYLQAKTSLQISHELEAEMLDSSLPLVVYNEINFLKVEKKGQKYLGPMAESLPFRHHRRNLFIVRNLGVTSAIVNIDCKGAIIRPMQPRLTAGWDALTVSMEPCASLVLTLSNAVADGQNALDSPVTFYSAKGGLLIFYIGEAIV